MGPSSSQQLSPRSGAIRGCDKDVQGCTEGRTDICIPRAYRDDIKWPSGGACQSRPADRGQSEGVQVGTEQFKDEQTGTRRACLSQKWSARARPTSDGPEGRRADKDCSRGVETDHQALPCRPDICRASACADLGMASSERQPVTVKRGSLLTTVHCVISRVIGSVSRDPSGASASRSGSLSSVYPPGVTIGHR